MICHLCGDPATTWRLIDDQPYHRGCADVEHARRWLEGQGYLVRRVMQSERRAS